MFKNKYVSYTVVTPSKGYSVERRYSEFDELRQVLLSTFMGYVVPPLPPKKVASNLAPELIEERKLGLQLFLNDLLKHPVIKHNELIMHFLALPRKEFEEILKASLKGNKDGLADYITLEGKAKIGFSENERLYCDKIAEATTKIKSLYADLRDASKEIADNFTNLSRSIARASDIFKNIAGIYFTLEDKTHSALYFRMNEGYSKLSKLYVNFSESYRKHFGDFFTFYKHEMDSIQELLSKSNLAYEMAQTAENKLLKKKEKSFELRNTQQWELSPSAEANIGNIISDKALVFKEMYPKETDNAMKLQILKGYYINKIIEEFARILIKDEVVIKAELGNAVNDFNKNENELKEAWTNLIRRLDELKKKVEEEKQ